MEEGVVFTRVNSAAWRATHQDSFQLGFKGVSGIVLSGYVNCEFAF
jgi:hypothetical protein